MKQTKPRTVEVPNRSHQPSRTKLREDLWLKETFEESIKTLVQPVRIKRVMPKNHSRGA